MDSNYNFPVELQPIYLANGEAIEARKAVVRTDTMNTLGIVSDDYGLVKHASVIDSFREAGRAYDVQEKISLTKNGAYLFYQMMFPKVQAEVRKGDFIRMMMIAKNSYNGNNSLQVIFGAFRLVCENGMILGTQFLSFNFRHIGDVGGNAGTDQMFMMGHYQEAYGNYIKLFGEKMPMITEMAKYPVVLTEDLFDQKRLELPKYLVDEAKQSFIEKSDNTAWGFYNALTFAITHRMKTSNPNLAIDYGIKAWKAAELAIN